MNKDRKMRRRIVSALALGLGLIAAGNTSKAAIVANFDDGAGSTSVDQYPGVAGDGWGTDWVTTANASGEILSGSPLNGGGNYLSVSTSLASSQGVYRTYTNFDGVDLTKKHVIQFDWRFSGNYDQLDQNTDRLYISDGTAASNGQASSTAFNIRVHGAARGTANAKEWAVFDGNQDGADITTADNQWVNTGMTMERDVVYSFTITLDPENRSYDVSIDNGTMTVTVTDLGFNRSTFDVSGTLHFRTLKSTGGDNLTFGFDSVQIAPVPEPTSLGLMACAAAMMARRRGH